MNRDHVVFAVCGFLLGLVIGSFLVGPKLARSRLAGESATAEAVTAAPSEAAQPAATNGGAAGGPPAAGPMAAVRQQLDALKQQIARNPRDFDALVQLANMYMDVGKYPQAIDYYERALAVREEPAIRTDLGICYKQSGQTDKAVAAFERVATEQPEQWQATFNLAIIYAETRRFDKARVELAQLKKLNADPAEVAKLEQVLASAK